MNISNSTSPRNSINVLKQPPTHNRQDESKSHDDGFEEEKSPKYTLFPDNYGTFAGETKESKTTDIDDIDHRDFNQIANFNSRICRLTNEDKDVIVKYMPAIIKILNQFKSNEYNEQDIVSILMGQEPVYDSRIRNKPLNLELSNQISNLNPPIANIMYYDQDSGGHHLNKELTQVMSDLFRSNQYFSWTESAEKTILKIQMFNKYIKHLDSSKRFSMILKDNTLDAHQTFISKMPPTGFRNKGNDCFVNSAIQLIKHTPRLLQLATKHQNTTIRSCFIKLRDNKILSWSEHQRLISAMRNYDTTTFSWTTQFGQDSTPQMIQRLFSTIDTTIVYVN